MCARVVRYNIPSITL